MQKMIVCVLFALTLDFVQASKIKRTTPSEIGSGECPCVLESTEAKASLHCPVRCNVFAASTQSSHEYGYLCCKLPEVQEERYVMYVDQKGRANRQAVMRAPAPSDGCMVVQMECRVRVCVRLSIGLGRFRLECRIEVQICVSTKC